MNNVSLYKSPAGERAIMAFYDAALARWPVPYEALNIATRHGDTFVIAGGQPDAPALVLLHGAGSNSAIWGGDVAVYSREYRVYAVDLLGEPGKSAPNRPPWDSPAYAEWLEDVLEVLKLDRVTLIGVSQGGWTALKFATFRPERVERLVLLCPGGVVPDRMSFFLRAMVLLPFGRRGADRLNRMLFGDLPVPEGVAEFTALIMTQFRSRTGILPIFSDGELRRLAMPVLFLGGEKDGMRASEKIAARLRALLPRCTTHIIPGAGHALCDTRPYILPFLTDPACALRSDRAS